MKTKNKVLTVLLIVLVFVNIPFKHIEADKYICVFQRHVLTGKRPVENIEGDSYSSVLWEYRDVCYNYSYKVRELIFFDTVGFTWK